MCAKPPTFLFHPLPLIDEMSDGSFICVQEFFYKKQLKSILTERFSYDRMSKRTSVR